MAESGRVNRRLAVIVVVLAFIGLEAVFVALKSGRQAPSGVEEKRGFSVVQKKKELFRPMGSPSAKVKVDVYLSFEDSCASCVEEARSIFDRLLQKHKGKVRFKFLNTDERGVREELVPLLKREGLLGVPPGDVWVFVDGRAKFKLGGETYILNHLPMKGDPSERFLERIIDSEVRAAYPASESM